MAWYLEKRRHVESEVKKYSEPPSDALLPDLPPQARRAALRPDRDSDQHTLSHGRACWRHSEQPAPLPRPVRFLLRLG